MVGRKQWEEEQNCIGGKTSQQGEGMGSTATAAAKVAGAARGKAAWHANRGWGGSSSGVGGVGENSSTWKGEGWDCSGGKECLQRGAADICVFLLLPNTCAC